MFVYQFADGMYAKGVGGWTTDIKKARLFRLKSHALSSCGMWVPRETPKHKLREGDKLINLNLEYPN